MLNPSVVRASLGTVFSVPVVRAEPKFRKGLDQAPRDLEHRRYAGRGSVVYGRAHMVGPCAILMGSEHAGLDGEWLNSPMNGCGYRRWGKPTRSMSRWRPR
ncbi:MAG: hypothetical protein CM1200mP9_08480 [Gammaproteobacteria bacterium]|nr:MAG: hypothetical protein CM1200mP9_08480 [Gammaproteobacteria bacterium]